MANLDRLDSLSRRERQVAGAVTRLGHASVGEIAAALTGQVSNDAVRAVLRLLRQKGIVRFERQGKRYVYFSSTPRRTAQERTLRHVVRTLFDGSRVSTMAALINLGHTRMSREEIDRLAALVDAARCDLKVEE